MNAHPKFNRRSFLVGSAAAVGGLSLGFHVPFGEALAAGETPEINAWVVIKPDETVVVRVVRSEMGQGSLTGLAQMVAEELECDWSKVTYEFPTPGQSLARKRVWRDFSTVGSRAIRTSHEYVRQGGAAARIMLIQAAADGWKVPASECAAANGVVTHGASKRSMTFGKLADAAAKVTPPDPKTIQLKNPKDWKILGKPLKRLDTPLKVNGSAQYGIDVRLPGMLYAAFKAAPVRGGKVKSFDAAKIQGRPGVKKVAQIEDYGVAVIADSWWRAKTALDALPITWDDGENAKVSSESIAKWLAEGLDAETNLVGNKGGDVKAGLASAAKKFSAVYAYPYQAHVTMEPMNATTVYTPDKLEMWASTQDGESSLAAASEASGLPVQKCDVHRTFLGGGFGRRGAGQDYIRHSVLIAKEMPGTPIKMVWTREEDMTHDWYHPVTQCKITAGLDKDNNLTAIHYRISGQSIIAGVMPARLQEGRDPATFSGFYPGGDESVYGYSVPNILVDHSMRNPHLKPGFWRGVNINHNAIYIESFMDELAKETNTDALEFRRRLMGKHPKHLAVLNAVAEKGGWGKPSEFPGAHKGLAQAHAFGSYVAACAEVSVDGNKVKIHRIVAATDPGHAANPAQIERQVAGSFVYGLTALFLGGITVKDGKVEQENFDSYDMMRIKEMPKVETIVMPSGGFWGGVGEPTICVAAPAVLNAIAAATGKRYRTFPLRDHGLYMV
jgi:isoquinoline 1-oxidoreductase subunit beta